MMSNLLQQLNGELAAVVDLTRRSLVKVNNGRRGAGAGVVWQSDGLILTNAHVVRQGSVSVTLFDGLKYPAKVVAYDEDRDLAALSIEAQDLSPLQLGASQELQPGQLVLALGHPWGVAGAVSAGPVINIGPAPEMSRQDRTFIQAGLQLRPGHSGGPMVDVQGRLVGINTMITGPEVGLAVPTHVIQEFLKHHVEKNEGLVTF